MFGRLHLPSLRDSILFRLPYLGLASQASACRSFAAKALKQLRLSTSRNPCCVFSPQGCSEDDVKP